MGKVFKFAIFILLVMVVLAGFRFLKPSITVVSPDRQINVSLKWLHQAQFAGMYVALEKDFYAKRGLKVNLSEFSANQPVVPTVLKGGSHFGITSANDMINARANGDKITALSAIYQVSPYVLVSLKGSQIITPRDLVGKKVGIKGGVGSEADLTADFILRSAGLSGDDVEQVYLDFTTSEKDDLVSGKVDVVGMYRTRLYLFEQEGVPFNPIYPEQYGLPVYNDVIFSSDDFIDSSPEAVKAFIEATQEGWEYAIKNQDEAIDIVMGYITNNLYRDRTYQRYILKSSTPLIKPSKNVTIGEMEFNRWEEFRKSMSNNPFVKDLDTAEIFTADYL